MVQADDGAVAVLVQREGASKPRRLPPVPLTTSSAAQPGFEEALLDFLRSGTDPAAALAAYLPRLPAVPSLPSLPSVALCKCTRERRTPRRMTKPLSVAVIGGGVAGLLTAKWMKEEGFRVVILEASDRLGGIWAEGSSRLYPTLHSNTTRSWMHFSDFEFPAPESGCADFPHHSEITAQVAAYTKHFGLARLAELGSRVDAVAEFEDGWRVRVNGIDRFFDRVCLCNGKLQEPVIPAVLVPGESSSSASEGTSMWPGPCMGPSRGAACVGLFPGAECGGGELQRAPVVCFHSSRLGSMGPDVFTGRRVVVVGFGQASGADVCELAAAQGAVSVTIAVEKPIFLVPRILDGRPVEDHISVLAALDPRLMLLLAQLPSVEKFPATAPQDFQPGVHTLTRVWTLHEMLACGRVTVRNGRVVSVQDAGVGFSDGGVLPADVVVWCTGYNSRALDVLEPQLRERLLQDAPLFEGMWAPDAPGLVAIGHDESVWYHIEMQARWAARVWSGSAARLPTPKVMREWIAKARAELSPLYMHLRREPTSLTVPGEATAKLLRMALMAGVWPSPPQVALRLLSTFEPRFAHGHSSV